MLKKKYVAIVGCGKVGMNLAFQLEKCKYRLCGVSSKSLDTVKRAAKRFKTTNFSILPWEITPDADIVFIVTPDFAIEETCRNIVGNRGFDKGTIVLHCSGVLPSTVLSSAKNAGVEIGSMHPLQCFAEVSVDKNPFKGINVMVEGDPEAVRIAKMISSKLGAKAVQISTEEKTLCDEDART